MTSREPGSLKAENAHMELADDAGPDFGATRRSFLRNALLAIGVSGAAFPAWDCLLAAAASGTPFIGAARFQVLDAVAETIMPRTDTPGARDALVPARFDGLMKTWASAETHADFARVLDEIDLAARMRDPRGIVGLSAPQQLEVVAAYDQAKLKDRAYLKFKGVILALYYLSEPGATQELRYEHVPGVWEPSIPVTPDTRAYAVDISI
ncbi:gluconate 2-dehydrogenase subunit 3 family protein [Novosphingobium sp. G106]|uniref:gluconate 2-dehydrogenase subunit 3 family protein n=1 Tax=Novosphingobium sp. G106 TaxID=2849500 RepID=UPI001C2DEAE7|nr:gluconate 2-dehydrogenase subunit 3 family protein [Novosphingobium sp. G106]MBV1689002.1 gluconate 2-dehydrogenase subunit 3 family protein [Novosphingobium sp. G106]